MDITDTGAVVGTITAGIEAAATTMAGTTITASTKNRFY